MKNSVSEALDSVEPLLRELVCAAGVASEERDDFVQEVFLKLLTRGLASKIDDIRHLRSYLRAAVENHKIDVGRKRAAERQAFQEYAEWRLRQNQESYLEFDGEFTISDPVRNEQIARVRRAIEQLNREDQTLVRLYYVEGLPTPEIAPRLKISRAATLRRLVRVRKKLKKILAAGE